MAQMPNSYHRARRRRLIAEGKCRCCLARPADEGYSSCARCREKNRVKEAERRATGTAHYNYETWRARRFARVYGITLVDYDVMFAAQGGKCCLCGGESNGRGRLAVDHDHRTGRVRGLLCFRCNTTVGAAERVGMERLTVYLGEALDRPAILARLDELLALELDPALPPAV